MKRASAIVTNRGGRTCHAAIIARELGIPAVVGCSDATSRIKEGQPVTVSCAEGDTGYVYDGQLEYNQSQIELDSLPSLPVKIMMNVGNPDRAFDFADGRSRVAERHERRRGQRGMVARSRARRPEHLASL